MENVEKTYTTRFGGNQVQALRNVSFSVEEGEFVAVIIQNQFAAQVERIEEQKKAVEITIAELQTLLDSRMDYWFN